ncbi:MAG: hypothetical protein ACK5PG_12325 [Lysobacterales bacterium]
MSNTRRTEERHPLAKVRLLLALPLAAISALGSAQDERGSVCLNGTEDGFRVARLHPPCVPGRSSLQVVRGDLQPQDLRRRCRAAAT